MKLMIGFALGFVAAMAVWWRAISNWWSYDQ